MMKIMSLDLGVVRLTTEILQVDVPSTSDEDSYASEASEPESEGFDHECESDDGASRGSFASRFKRYVKRIMPNVIRRGSRSDGNEIEDTEEDGDRVEEQCSHGNSLENDACDKETNSHLSSHLSEDRCSEIEDGYPEEE